MGTAERRNEIMRILCRRRHETVSNLASEFGVSERTILRDIDALSNTEPIYTKSGKYGGGVYVMESYYMDCTYMTQQQLSLLQKVYSLAEYQLNEDDKRLFQSILSQYTKPQIKKGNNNENTRKRAI